MKCCGFVPKCDYVNLANTTTWANSTGQEHRARWSDPSAAAARRRWLAHGSWPTQMHTRLSHKSEHDATRIMRCVFGGLQQQQFFEREASD